MQLCGLFGSSRRRHARARQRHIEPPTSYATSGTPRSTSRCNARCGSVCVIHNRKAGDFLKTRDAAKGQTRRRSASYTVTGSRDSSALYMSSPSERASTPRRMLPKSKSFGGRGNGWMQWGGGNSSDHDGWAQKNNQGTPSGSRKGQYNNSSWYNISSTTAGSRPSGVSARRKKGLGIASPSSLAPLPPSFVVVDGSRVGCALDTRGKFRSKAVRLSLDYYAKCGVRAVALLPQNKVDDTPMNRHRGLLADDVPLLRRLAKQGKVVFTPAGTSDDAFLLDFAMRRNADIVSNVRYRAQVEYQKGTQAKRNMKSFLDVHLIPFVFVAGQFSPHPDPKRMGTSIHHRRVKRGPQNQNRVYRARTV